MSESTPSAADARVQLERMNAQTDEQNEAEHKARNKFAHPTRASEHELERIEWLWKPYIPLASLSGIYAHEGTGKGVLVGMVAALATLGLLDGNLAGEPTTVEFFSFEDNYSAVVKPRLIAAGADEDMCLFHTGEDAIDPADRREGTRGSDQGPWIEARHHRPADRLPARRAERELEQRCSQGADPAVEGGRTLRRCDRRKHAPKQGSYGRGEQAHGLEGMAQRP